MASVLPLYGTYAKPRIALLPFSVTDPFIFHVLTTAPFKQGKRQLSKEERQAFLPRLIAAGARITPKKVRSKIWLQRHLWMTEMPTERSGEIYDLDSLAGDDSLLFFTAGAPYGIGEPTLAFHLSTLLTLGKVGVRSYDLLSAYEQIGKELGNRRTRPLRSGDFAYLLREYARRATFSEPGQVELILRERAKTAFVLASATSYQQQLKLEVSEGERLTRIFAPLLDSQREQLRAFAPLLEKMRGLDRMLKSVASPEGPIEVVLAPHDTRGVRLASSTFFHPGTKREKQPVFDWTLTKLVQEAPGALAGLSSRSKRWP